MAGWKIIHYSPVRERISGFVGVNPSEFSEPGVNKDKAMSVNGGMTAQVRPVLSAFISPARCLA